ncbi:carbon-nitrogen hydrolase family protein [Chloroflexota bacterium]
MRDEIKIAAVQMEPRIMENRENLNRVLLDIRTVAQNGADLIVFPECALSGYVFNSRAAAIPFMETIPGPATGELSTCCKELGVHVVLGLLEIDGDRCFNTAVLVGPQGLIGKYRKNHLPFLGIDRYIDRGDKPFQVYNTPIGNIGLHICYDCNFPESARVMALLGADILVLPTNWPEGRGKIPQYVINTRAYENRVHLVAVDRVGIENGTRFIGLSKIVNVQGDTLAQGSADDEQIIYAEVSLAEARQKHIILKPGEFEIDVIHDRRPELYGELVMSRKAERGS